MPFSELNTTTAHVQHGIKTGIAALLAYSIVSYFGLQFGFWAVLSAVIVMQIHVADSIRMCWYRLSGTAVGAIIGLFTILAFPETPLMTAAGLFCAVSFCAYMTRYNPRYRMAAITVVVVVLASAGQEERLLFSIYRVLEIAIGVGCAFTVSILLWPLRAGLALKKRLAEHFMASARTYEAILSAFLTRQPATLPKELAELDEHVVESRTLLRKVLQHERLFFDDDARLLAQQLELLEKVTEHLHSMAGLQEAPHLWTEEQPEALNAPDGIAPSDMLPVEVLPEDHAAREEVSTAKGPDTLHAHTKFPETQTGEPADTAAGTTMHAEATNQNVATSAAASASPSAASTTSTAGDSFGDSFGDSSSYSPGNSSGKSSGTDTPQHTTSTAPVHQHPPATAPDMCLYMEKELGDLATATAEVLRAIGTGHPPHIQLLQNTLKAADHKLAHIRKSGSTRSLPLQTLLQVLGFYTSMHALGESLLDGLARQKGKTADTL